MPMTNCERKGETKENPQILLNYDGYLAMLCYIVPIQTSFGVLFNGFSGEIPETQWTFLKILVLVAGLGFFVVVIQRDGWLRTCQKCVK